MYQIVQQTHEEKVEMYMKIEKERLVSMLIQANNVLTATPVSLSTFRNQMDCDHQYKPMGLENGKQITGCPKCTGRRFNGNDY